MSIWVTGSLEVRDSSDRLVLQVGDSSGDSPTKSMSTEVTGSFEVVSNADTANYRILSASHNGVAPAVGIGVTAAPNVNFAVGGDLGLTDTASDSRLVVQAPTNAYLNVGVNNNNRGFMFWEGNDQRIRFGTKESGVEYFNSFIIKSGSADILSNLTVGAKITTVGNVIVGGDVQTVGSIAVGSNAIQASDLGTVISWDVNDNVTIAGDLTINGNDIKDSGNQVVFSFDGSGNIDNTPEFGASNSLDVHDRIRHMTNTATNIRFYGNTDDKVGIETSAGGMMVINAPGVGDKSIVFNDTGVDVDFQVKTNGNDNTLYVLGSSDAVGIKKNNPAYPLDVAGDIALSGDLRLGGNVIRASDGGATITLDTSDNVTIGGIIQLNGNAIQASDGGTPISWDTSDNVLIYGDLQVRGNDIKGSAGSNAITIDDQDITVAGILKVGGDSIQDSVSNEVITFDTSGNTSVEGELLIAGNIVRDSSAASVMQFDGSGGVTFTDTATRARLQRFVTDPFKMSLQVSNAANAIATSAGATRRYLFSNLQGAADKSSTYWNFVRGYEVRNQSTTADVDTALSNKWIPPSTSERFEQYNSMSWVVPADCVITTMVVTLFGEHKPKPRNLTGLQDSDIMISIARSTPATSYIDGGNAGTSYIDGNPISSGGDLLIDFMAGTDIGNINPGDSIEIDLSGLQDMDTTLSAGTKLYMGLRMNWQPTSGDNIFYEYSQTGDTTQSGGYVDTGYLSYHIILTGYYV